MVLLLVCLIVCLLVSVVLRLLQIATYSGPVEKAFYFNTENEYTGRGWESHDVQQTLLLVQPLFVQGLMNNKKGYSKSIDSYNNCKSLNDVQLDEYE